MKKFIFSAILLSGMLAGCSNKEQNEKEENMTPLTLTLEWAKAD